MQAQRRGNASHGSCSRAAEIHGYTRLALRMAGGADLEAPSSPTELWYAWGLHPVFTADGGEGRA